MILIINTSSPGIGLCLDGKFKHIETEKQSLSLPIEVEKFLSENNCWFTTTPSAGRDLPQDDIKTSPAATPSPAKGIRAIGIVVGPGSFTGIRIGIAYAKGLGIGLDIPVVPINAFEIYLERNPDAFVAIDSGRADLFAAARDIDPCTMDIEKIETEQMKYAKTVGHKPFDLCDALPIVMRKLNSNEPVIPMYLRPSYAETNRKTS